MGLAQVEEVTIGEEVTVEPGGMRHLPAVDDVALEVYEVDVAGAIHGGVEDVSRAGFLRVVEGNTGRCGAPTGLLVGKQWDLLRVWSIDYEVLRLARGL